MVVDVYRRTGRTRRIPALNVSERVYALALKLAVWARWYGVHPQTAYRWFHDGEERRREPGAAVGSTTSQQCALAAALSLVETSDTERQTAPPSAVRG